jgi:nitrous oxide reductase accessory protein NosL
MRRRTLLAHGLAWTPFSAPFTALIAGCGDEGTWPEGMLPFKWDRDVCLRCGMAISDRRFPAQIRGGPKNIAFKFDDIGCASTWYDEKLKEHPWMTDAATRFWVAEFGSKGDKWLDARNAYYLGGKTSPMGYNYAALPAPQPGTLKFDAMSKVTASMWPANCLPGSTVDRPIFSAASAPK